MSGKKKKGEAGETNDYCFRRTPVSGTSVRTPLFIGIDLGGTKILTAVADPTGNLVSRDQSVTPASGGPESVIAAIVESVGRSLNQAGITIAEVTAVGVAAPGPSDSVTGILHTPPNLPGWHEVPLRDIIQAKLGKATFLINDAQAAALGELTFGAGRGARNFVYITLSTGIGGGIIIDGKLYRGARGFAGEVGHMTIDDRGPLCHCGNTGCLEVLASGSALAREARRLIQEEGAASLLDYAGGDITEVTAETIHLAAINGDSVAQELIARAAYYIGVGLGSLINLFNPELIVIGGGLANMGDILLKPAFEVAAARAFRHSYRAVRFARAALGHNSGVLGATVFARQEAAKGDTRH
jgi:glucokinase